MSVSTRTPEGVPNHCPVCQNKVCIEPSLPFGDAPCPNCGTLLWFVNVKSGVRFFDPHQSMVVKRIAEELGIAERKIHEGNWDELGIDSLHLVELIMEIEK